MDVPSLFAGPCRTAEWAVQPERLRAQDYFFGSDLAP